MTCLDDAEASSPGPSGVLEGRAASSQSRRRASTGGDATAAGGRRTAHAFGVTQEDVIPEGRNGDDGDDGDEVSFSLIPPSACILHVCL